ncbi:WD repeat-containing protein wrap73 [Linnemannia zychae]|nr:WD repeat-containing protein wrap73 [Linnemannia zychae]
MDFTEPYKHSQFLTLYSPNGKYLASYHLVEEGFTRLHPSSPIQPHEHGGRGVIVFRFAATMQIMRAIEIRLFRDSLPTISEIGWSPDSSMLLAACPVTGTVLVFSVEEEGFKATITAPGIVTSGNSGGGSSTVSPTIGGAPGSPNGSGGHHRSHSQKGEIASAKTAQAFKALGYSPPGAEILRGVRFSADSRHVLIWEDHLLRLSVWSLENHNNGPSYPVMAPPSSPSKTQQPRQAGPKVCGIQHPKATTKSSVTSASMPPYSTLGTTATSAAGPHSQYAYSLRGDLQYAAIVERNGKECRDYVSIYATENYWSGPPIHSFGVAEGEGGLKDVEGIVWSPDGRYLVLWENPNLGFKVAAYSIDGRCIGSYEVKLDSEQQPMHGYAISTLPGFSHGGGAMGIKSVCWHPKSKLLALGGYDQKIRILNHLTWKPILEFNHVAHVHYGPKTVLWRESESTVALTDSVRQKGGIEYTMVVEQSAWVLPTIRIDTQKPNAKIGIGWCDFNCDGTLLASRNDSMPNVLWIWSMTELKLKVIIQQQSPIRVARWDPNTPSRIVWCCGSSRVYSWNATFSIAVAADPQQGGYVEAVEVPAENFTVTSLKWCPDGRGLLLLDKDMFCVAFPIEDQDQHTIHDNTASIFQRLR